MLDAAYSSGEVRRAPSTCPASAEPHGVASAGHTSVKWPPAAPESSSPRYRSDGAYEDYVADSCVVTKEHTEVSLRPFAHPLKYAFQLQAAYFVAFFDVKVF